MLGNLLIIDDDLAVLESLDLLLRGESQSIKTLSDPNQLNSALERTNFDAVLLDMNYTTGRNTGNEGLFWLREVLKSDPDYGIDLEMGKTDKMDNEFEKF